MVPGSMVLSSKPCRVLAYGDSPTCPTGLGTVMRHVLAGLHGTDRYEIDLIGINFFGDYYDREKFPYRIYPACRLGGRDFYGRKRLTRALSGEDGNIHGPWDILLTIHDDFVFEPIMDELLEVKEWAEAENRPFIWIAYWPVDNTIKESWVRNVNVMADFNVLYTEFAHKDILRHDTDGSLGYLERTRVIPHGVDTSVFRPLPPDDVAQYRDYHFQGRVGPDTYLLTNVNRNQWRKDLPRTMAVFAEFHRRVPDSFLYLHTSVDDKGGDLTEVARHFGLEIGRDWGCPQGLDFSIGASRQELNYLYNASSAVVTTTRGEGWGFSITEAMAAGTLVVAPHNSSIPELLGNETTSDMVRGISVKCGGPSLWIHGGKIDHDGIRPLTDVEDMVDKLVFAYENPDRMEQCVLEALGWIQNLNWDTVNQTHWVPLFKKAEEYSR